MPVNWEAQRRMDENIKEHADLYIALAGNVTDSCDDDE